MEPCPRCLGDCNPECHRVERIEVTDEIHRCVRLRFDGDPTTIRVILECIDHALANLPPAA